MLESHPPNPRPPPCAISFYDSMKRKHPKTLDAIMRPDGNVDTRKVEALVVELGGTVTDRGNGLYAVAIGERDMVYDHPHPRNEIGRGLAKRFREFFREVGIA